jgi:hypothetical protein
VPTAPSRREGLTDTKEGRLAIIVVVAGTILVVAAFANVLGNNAADAEADSVRAALREELGELPDDEALVLPAEQGGPIDKAVGRVLRRHPGELVAVGRPEHRHMTVVAVETGWTWWPRCVRAELRGDHTVLTRVSNGTC